MGPFISNAYLNYGIIVNSFQLATRLKAYEQWQKITPARPADRDAEFSSLIAEQERLLLKEGDGQWEPEWHCSVMSDSFSELFGLKISNASTDDKLERHQMWVVSLPSNSLATCLASRIDDGYGYSVFDPLILKLSDDKNSLFEALVETLGIDTYCPKELIENKLVKTPLNPQWLVQVECTEK